MTEAESVRRDPMSEEHARLLLLPMFKPYYEAAMAAWRDYLWYRSVNDRFTLRPTTLGSTLHDAVCDHLTRNMAPAIEAKHFGKKEIHNFPLFIARERCGYNGHLGVKVNSTDSEFRLSTPDTDAAERRLWQEPLELPLFGIFEDPIVKGPGEIGTWVTAAYCADSTLTHPPALAFSCQRGDKVLWKLRVDESVVIESDKFVQDHAAEYVKQLRSLRRRQKEA